MNNGVVKLESQQEQELLNYLQGEFLLLEMEEIASLLQKNPKVISKVSYS